MPEATLGTIAGWLGAELLGDPALRITALAPLDAAGPEAVAFLAHARYRGQLASTRAGAVIVAPAERDAAAARGAVLVCADPYLAFARLTQRWAALGRPRPQPGVHPTAVVEEGAQVDPTAHVGALAFVGAGARIGPQAVVGAHAVVGAGAQVGPGTQLRPRAVLGEGCRIGARGLVHGGAVIGADGFGFAPVALDPAQPQARRWEKIEQLGSVLIGDDVEIGANTCIDRGALGDTVLGDGVKLDNLVQIGHNVQVGAHTAMAGCAGVAGSARIGAFCTLGGGAIVLGHLTLADHVHVSAATVVTRSIARPGHYSGVFPFDDNAAWEKNAATLRQLHGLRDRLRALEKRQPGDPADGS